MEVDRARAVRRTSRSRAISGVKRIPSPAALLASQAGAECAGERAGAARAAGSGTGLYGSEIGSNMSRAAVAEIVGTFILVYAGTTVAVLATLGVPVRDGLRLLAVPLAFGLTLAALVAALGHVSGAHLNPAVTLGLAATRKFPWPYVPTYVVAQLIGAKLGIVGHLDHGRRGGPLPGGSRLARAGAGRRVSCRGSSSRRSSPSSWSSS